MNKKILAGVTMFGLIAAYMLPFSVTVGHMPIAQASMSDYYLKLDGIEGEVVAKGHEKEVQVLSWSLGASNPTSLVSGGMSTGKVHFQDFRFTKSIDKATPMLFLACANGKHIPNLVLMVTKSNSVGLSSTYMKYSFKDVMCTSFQNSADPLIEEVSFTYQKIWMENTLISTTGEVVSPVTAGWDLKMNKAI